MTDTKLVFDITNDRVVMERYREMTKNDMEFSAIKRDAIIDEIDGRKLHQKQYVIGLYLDAAKVLIGVALVLVLIVKL